MSTLPELRKDPVLGCWVIVARERGLRPNNFLFPSLGISCPLCFEHEEQTSCESLRLASDGSVCTGEAHPWQVRVVANKYPALVLGADQNIPLKSLFEKRGAVGVHEIIIETPLHNESFAELGSDYMALVFKAYLLRSLALESNKLLQYVMIFKNHGHTAGASLVHSHSQLVALPVEPHSVAMELAGAREYYIRHGRCVYSDIVKSELQCLERVVCQNEEFIVLVPFASRTPFEMQVISKRHYPDFTAEDDSRLFFLAEMVGEALRRLEQCVPNVSYNLVLHTGPLRVKNLPYYQYHIEILPKLTSPAGFEWGSGGYINPVVPEEAAAWLREV